MEEFEKEKDYTKEEEIELNSIYMSRNAFMSFFIILYIALLLLGSYLISSSIESSNGLTESIIITSVLAFFLTIITISVFVHYQKLINKAKRNDQIRHDEKVRYKERERLDQQKYDRMYNEIYEKVKREYEEQHNNKNLGSDQ